MSATHIGILVGAVLGVVLIALGLWQAIVVGLFMLGGYFVGKYIGGGLPIVDALLERFLQ